MIAPLVYAFLLCFILLYWKDIWEKIFNRWKIIKALHPLPGPLALPIIGAGWLLRFDRKAMAKQITRLGAYYSKQGYGLIKVWAGPLPKVLIIKAEMAKTVLESNALITKGDEYTILIPWLGTGLLISTGEKWQQRRKLLTPSFHFKMLNNFVTVFNEQSRVLLEQIVVASQNEFDIFPYIKRCALDIICETAMGHTVTAQINHDHQYVLSVTKLAELVVNYNRRPYLQLKPIWWLSGNSANYAKHLKIVTDFTTEVIREKIESSKESVPVGGRKVFLDMLLELYKEGKINYEDIREEVDTFMFAGHDTTSTSIGWTLWCLAHNEECQKRVHQELDSVFGDSNRDVSIEDLPNLKYFERCIKEAFRLRPTVPYFIRKVDQDFDVGEGNVIPKGVSIIVCPYVIHIDKNQFENADQFDPDRFLEENISKRHPYSFIPFSAGPRNCIGQKFALLEEKVILAWILRKYRVRSSISFEENCALPELISRPILGFPVSIEARS